MNSQIVIGVDPGLTCTGYAILDENRRCISFGGIKTTNEMTDDARNCEIVAQLMAVLFGIDPPRRPKVAAVEQYVFQGNQRTNNSNALRLSRLVGCIESAFRAQGLTVVGYSRGEGLQALGLPSNASKASAKNAVKRLVKSKGFIIPSNEHSCAAYAQAWAAHVQRVGC